MRPRRTLRQPLQMQLMLTTPMVRTPLCSPTPRTDAQPRAAMLCTPQWALQLVWTLKARTRRALRLRLCCGRRRWTRMATPMSRHALCHAAPPARPVTDSALRVRRCWPACTAFFRRTTQS